MEPYVEPKILCNFLFISLLFFIATNNDQITAKKKVHQSFSEHNVCSGHITMRAYKLSTFFLLLSLFLFGLLRFILTKDSWICNTVKPQDRKKNLTYMSI